MLTEKYKVFWKIEGWGKVLAGKSRRLTGKGRL